MGFYNILTFYTSDIIIIIAKQSNRGCNVMGVIVSIFVVYNFYVKDGTRAGDTIILQDTAEVWNCISNYGCLGGEIGSGFYGLTWPGGIAINNYYLWNSYFLIGVRENDTPYVTAHNYPRGEWGSGQVIYHGPGVSEEDVIISWHDSLTNPYNASGRHLGVEVLVNSYAWSYEPWNDFIVYEILVIWNKDQCDIPQVGDTLNNLFLGMWYDCDVSGADQSNPHIDDWVFFDGYTAHEWDTLGYPYDSITLLPDTFLNIPDGVYDQYIVYGDDSLEHTLHGDTLLLPRNLSFMWDGDDSSTPENDIGENGFSAGYVGGSLIYAPPSPADTVWIDNYGDTCRIVRVWGHQWWDWEHDPANDAELYDYLSGTHYFTDSMRFAYLPDAEFDFRFLTSSGPFNVADGETLKFVWVAAVGQGMNGGRDSVYGREWIRGLRQTIDYALTAYYAGSQISDPYHPSAPDEDFHWNILSVSEKNYKNKARIHLPSILNSSFVFKSNTTLEIYNVSGRKIGEITIKNKGFPFKGLEKGVYFVKIKGGGIKKVILLH